MTEIKSSLDEAEARDHGEQSIDLRYAAIHAEIANAVEHNLPDEYVVGLGKLLEIMQTEVSDNHGKSGGDWSNSFMGWVSATRNFAAEKSQAIKAGEDQYRLSDTTDNNGCLHFAVLKLFGRQEVAINNSSRIAGVVASFVNVRGGGFVMARALDCIQASNESLRGKRHFVVHSAYAVSTKLVGFKPKVE